MNFQKLFLRQSRLRHRFFRWFEDIYTGICIVIDMIYTYFELFELVYDRGLNIGNLKSINMNEKTVSLEQYKLANCCLGTSFQRNLLDASLKP